MQLFFSTDYNDTQILLHGSEAEHCAKVLRHKVGDIIHVINGKGDFFVAEIGCITKQNVSAQILTKESDSGLPTHEVHLIFPFLKSRENVEWATEKATELGVTHLYFTPTSRSERSLIKRERIEKILISSLKQCLRRRLPIVSFPENWNNALIQTKHIQHKYIAYCEEKVHQFNINQNELQHQTVIAIGPEGDFTPSEVSDAQKFGFKIVSLGHDRLRSETAMIYMLALLKMQRDNYNNYT